MDLLDDVDLTSLFLHAMDRQGDEENSQVSIIRETKRILIAKKPLEIKDMVIYCA